MRTAAGAQQEPHVRDAPRAAALRRAPDDPEVTDLPRARPCCGHAPSAGSLEPVGAGRGTRRRPPAPTSSRRPAAAAANRSPALGVVVELVPARARRREEHDAVRARELEGRPRGLLDRAAPCAPARAVERRRDEVRRGLADRDDGPRGASAPPASGARSTPFARPPAISTASSHPGDRGAGRVDVRRLRVVDEPHAAHHGDELAPVRGGTKPRRPSRTAPGAAPNPSAAAAAAARRRRGRPGDRCRTSRGPSRPSIRATSSPSSKPTSSPGRRWPARNQASGRARSPRRRRPRVVGVADVHVVRRPGRRRSAPSPPRRRRTEPCASRWSGATFSSDRHARVEGGLVLELEGGDLDHEHVVRLACGRSGNGWPMLPHATASTPVGAQDAGEHAGRRRLPVRAGHGEVGGARRARARAPSRSRSAPRARAPSRGPRPRAARPGS